MKKHKYDDNCPCSTCTLQWQKKVLAVIEKNDKGNDQKVAVGRCEIVIGFTTGNESLELQLLLNKIATDVNKRLKVLKLYGGIEIKMQTVGRVFASNFVPVKEKKRGRHAVTHRRRR